MASAVEAGGAGEAGGARAAVLEAGQRWAASQFDLVRLVAELDTSLEWAIDGVPTCAHWVADALDVEVCTAREWLRIGRALRVLPTIAAAFEARRLSYSKVRALSRVATSTNEAELCEIAERVPAGRLAHALASWLQRHETPEQTAARHAAATGLTQRLEPDGMGLTTLRLPPLEHAALAAAIDAKVLVSQSSFRASADASGRWPSIAQQRAHALLELLRDGDPSVATEVIVHVRGDGCTMDDGTPVTDHAVAQLLPESFIRLLITEANRLPINASGRHRYPTARQQRVARERHGNRCVDCGSTDLLEDDHVPGYAQNHQTLVDEIEPRCPECHHDRHRSQEHGA
ncbi:MAG TPA: DUF222 domain-containing protein [Acidimicrobiia bacterium]|nr:DUF222 domain-containing protein [Acidimicrobiia bacterium]